MSTQHHLLKMKNAAGLTKNQNRRKGQTSGRRVAAVGAITQIKIENTLPDSPIKNNISKSNASNNSDSNLLSCYSKKFNNISGTSDQAFPHCISSMSCDDETILCGNSNGNPSIIMMPSDIALEDESLVELQHNESDGVVVEEVPGVGVSLENGVSFDMLNDYTIDIHADHIIDDHVNMNQCDMMEDVTHHNSLTEHVIFEEDIYAQSIVKEPSIQCEPVISQELDEEAHLYEETNKLLTEPDCQLVIKVRLHS